MGLHRVPKVPFGILVRVAEPINGFLGQKVGILISLEIPCGPWLLPLSDDAVREPWSHEWMDTPFSDA